MKTVNPWAALLNGGAGCQGLGSSWEVSCFSKGEEGLSALCFLHEKDNCVAEAGGLCWLLASLMLPVGEVCPSKMDAPGERDISSGTGTPMWVSCSLMDSQQDFGSQCLATSLDKF